MTYSIFCKSFQINIFNIFLSFKVFPMFFGFPHRVSCVSESVVFHFLSIPSNLSKWMCSIIFSFFDAFCRILGGFTTNLLFGWVSCKFFLSIALNLSKYMGSINFFFFDTFCRYYLVYHAKICVWVSYLKIFYAVLLPFVMILNYVFVEIIFLPLSSSLTYFCRYCFVS